MALLQQVFGTPPFPAHIVAGPTTTLGRHEDCEIVVESPAVSRFHAKITRDEDCFFVEDLQSRNGTLVNGILIQSRVQLQDGDQIEICTLPFTFHSEVSMSEMSGSEVMKPKLICLSQTGSDSGDSRDSVRRETVQTGDRLTNGQLGSDAVRGSRVVTAIRINDSSCGWPVTQEAPEKLNHTLRLLHLYRRVTERDELLSKTLEFLFDVFRTADRIAVVLCDDDASNDSGIHVASAGARHPDVEVEVALPLIRTAMESLEALLYVDNQRCSQTVAETKSASMTGRSHRSILVCPLVDAAGVCTGAIQLDSSDRQQPPEPKDLERLMVLSHLLGAALEQVARFAQQLTQLRGSQRIESETIDA